MHYSQYLEKLGFVKLEDTPELATHDVYINFKRSISLIPKVGGEIQYLNSTKRMLTIREAMKLSKLLVLAEGWQPPIKTGV